MHLTRKPIHPCYTCLLNQGDHCWGYRYPGQQWTGRRACPAFENDTAYQMFNRWRKEAHVKTRPDLRREARKPRRRDPVPHLESAAARGRPDGGPDTEEM